MDFYNSKHEGVGLLEYDLKHDFYRKIKTESYSESRMSIEETGTVTKGKYLKTITIELVK